MADAPALEGQDSVLDRLDGILANLQAHIEERARELAQPLVYDAREAAATEVKMAQDKQQRAEDLVTELRRQIRVLDRQRDEQRQRVERAEADRDFQQARADKLDELTRNFQQRAKTAEAANARTRERLDVLIAAGFGATTDTLRDLRATLNDSMEDK